MFDRKRFFRPVRVLLVILIAILLIEIGYIVFVKTKNRMDFDGRSVTELFEKTVGDIIPKLDVNQKSREETDTEKLKREEASAEPGIVIDGYPVIAAAAGEQVIKNINLRNAAENKDWYYISYELRFPDESEKGYEVLFRTDLIEPGNTVMDITLSRVLEIGEYDCILHIQPYYISTLRETNNADISTKLIVK